MSPYQEPNGAVQYSVACIQYRPRAGGGGQPPNIRRVQFALRFRAVYHFVDKLPHLLSTISIFLAIYYFVGFMLLDFGAEIRG